MPCITQLTALKQTEVRRRRWRFWKRYTTPAPDYNPLKRAFQELNESLARSEQEYQDVIEAVKTAIKDVDKAVSACESEEKRTETEKNKTILKGAILGVAGAAGAVALVVGTAGVGAVPVALGNKPLSKGQSKLRR